jgi:hypothetical protein
MASQDQVLGPFLNNGWINVGVFMSRALVTRLKTAKPSASAFSTRLMHRCFRPAVGSESTYAAVRVPYANHMGDTLLAAD